MTMRDALVRLGILPREPMVESSGGLHLYPAPVAERMAATAELEWTERAVLRLVELYAQTGREELLALLVDALRQHHHAVVAYRAAFASPPPPLDRGRG